MSRIKFVKITQQNYLNNIKEKTNNDWPTLAKICGVHSRTFFDWRRNRYQMSSDALKRLQKEFKLTLPRGVETLPDTWHIKRASRLGGIKRNELYGNPGTPEGRRKGGLATCLKFKNNPTLAKKSGFIIRKQIFTPTKTPLLAEFIGIVLGDGGVTDYQVKIFTNSKTDLEHAYFIKKIVYNLFNLKASISFRIKNTVVVTCSGKNLVNFLVKCGLKKGNKVAQSVNVPPWILKNNKFLKSCLRGLIDTDGGIYFHVHVTKGIKYRHIGLCFSNHSKPLLDSVYNMFLQLGIKAKNDGRCHIFIYDRKELNKYMILVGSHNKKHIRRFKSYKNSLVI